MPSKKTTAETAKTTERSKELTSLRRKGKKVNEGINPATKQPHTERFLKTL